LHCQKRQHFLKFRSSKYRLYMRAVIIYNPYAGQAGSLSQALDEAAAVWTSRGWQISLNPTAGPGDGTRLARLAVENGCDMVIAAGGDGTINEVVNGLAGSSTVLATLPLGTMNVWARELKLPLQPRAAAETMLSWKARPIDLGRAGERYFLLMAGIGFDAAITYSIQPDEKRRLGALAYVLLGIKMALQLRGARTRLVLDGKKIRGRVLMVVVGNTQLYGGLVRITHRASIDDGLLDVCVFKGDNLWNGLLHTISILRQQYSIAPEIEYYRARHVRILSRPELPVQVDGDSIGRTPMTFEVAAGALQALMPPTLPDDLVSRPVVAASGMRGMQRLAAWFLQRSRPVHQDAGHAPQNGASADGHVPQVRMPSTIDE
jgi:YegS/Rv2252/BmrU family lipid kinase